MQTQIISATKARNNFFSLLTALKMGSEFIIQKDNEVIGRLIPIVTDEEAWEVRKKGLMKALRETRGILKGKKFMSHRRKRFSRWLDWKL